MHQVVARIMLCSLKWKGWGVKDRGRKRYVGIVRRMLVSTNETTKRRVSLCWRMSDGHLKKSAQRFWNKGAPLISIPSTIISSVSRVPASTILCCTLLAMFCRGHDISLESLPPISLIQPHHLEWGCLRQSDPTALGGDIECLPCATSAAYLIVVCLDQKQSWFL